MFIREQRLYPIKSLKMHLEEGDLGNDHFGEILPHPFCDFCDDYFFDAETFFNHLHRQHFTCNLCSHHHKNVYYGSYEDLEIHFEKTHFICPYDACKAKCYVAFKTEDELRTHLDIEHNQVNKEKKVISAKGLLGFDIVEDREAQLEAEDEERKGRKNKQKRDFNRTDLKDTQGVNFNYYFSEKYQNCLEKKRQLIEKRKNERGNRKDKFDEKEEEKRGEEGIRGKGRGRGERGRGRGRGGRGGKSGPEEESKHGDHGQAGSHDPEQRISFVLAQLSDYIKGKMKRKELDGSYTYPRNQLYQMYFCLNRLDAGQFIKLNYVTNFGISPEIKTSFMGILDSKAGRTGFYKYFDSLDTLVLLKIHKYFFWADKKLHSVFFIDNKDSISEDLLNDFKDEDEKIVSSQQLGAKKGKVAINEPKVQKIQNLTYTAMTTELKYGSKANKYVDINDDQDFPDLDAGAKTNKRRMAVGA